MSVKKIVLIGPESTGKSTLAITLAQHYNTYSVAEFARQYLQNKNGNYTIKDLDAICNGQVLEEIAGLQKANNFIFLDTNAYTIKIWSEVKYNACSKIILDAIVNNSYDYYLLLDIDLPWQYDTLREAPQLQDRMQLMHCYKDAIVNSSVPFSIITGIGDARVQQAVTAINTAYQL
jgi:NadR type nicotinamide-nucleotide adenylyltransferase